MQKCLSGFWQNFDKFTVRSQFRRVFSIVLAYSLCLYFVISFLPTPLDIQLLQHGIRCQVDGHSADYSSQTDTDPASKHDYHQCCLNQIEVSGAALSDDVPSLSRPLIYNLVTASDGEMRLLPHLHNGAYFQSRAPPNFV